MIIRAWRRGLTNDPTHPAYTPMLRWRVGRLPAWQAHLSLLAHYRYRGEHRAHRFSHLVSDVADSVKATPWRLSDDGKFMVFDGSVHIAGAPEGMFLAIRPVDEAVTSLPALIPPKIQFPDKFELVEKSDA